MARPLCIQTPLAPRPSGELLAMNPRMITRTVNLRSLLWALLVPLVGVVPFLVFLRRDFAAFQLLNPHAAAGEQAVPWSWERAIAALIALTCISAGLLQLGYRSFASSGPLANVPSWQRLL